MRNHLGPYSRILISYQFLLIYPLQFRYLLPALMNNFTQSKKQRPNRSNCDSENKLILRTGFMWSIVDISVNFLAYHLIWVMS